MDLDLGLSNWETARPANQARRITARAAGASVASAAGHVADAALRELQARFDKPYGKTGATVVSVGIWAAPHTYGRVIPDRCLDGVVTSFRVLGCTRSKEPGGSSCSGNWRISILVRLRPA